MTTDQIQRHLSLMELYEPWIRRTVKGMKFWTILTPPQGVDPGRVGQFVPPGNLVSFASAADKRAGVMAVFNDVLECTLYVAYIDMLKGTMSNLGYPTSGKVRLCTVRQERGGYVLVPGDIIGNG